MITAEQAAMLNDRELMYTDAPKGNMLKAVKPEAFAFTDSELLQAAKRRDKREAMVDYQERVPCLACMKAVVIRTLHRGRVIGNEYVCTNLQMPVSKFGSCRIGTEGKGPTVLVMDKSERLLAKRDSEGTVTSIPQPTPVQEHDLKIEER